MKIKSIEAMCKNEKYIHIVNHGRNQWIAVGAALYPLYGYPELNENNVYILFDIPQDKRSSVRCQIDDGLPFQYDYSDAAQREREIPPCSFTLNIRGGIYMPLRTSRGIAYLNNLYLSPFKDVKNGIGLFERESASGQLYIAVKDGLLLSGIILPETGIITDCFADELANISQMTERAFHDLAAE